MPYIPTRDRQPIWTGMRKPCTTGELTYLFTRAVLVFDAKHQAWAAIDEITKKWIDTYDPSFRTFCEILGALTATEMEASRRVPDHARFWVVSAYREYFYEAIVAPYEDDKLNSNGEVYTCA